MIQFNMLKNELNIINGTTIITKKTKRTFGKDKKVAVNIKKYDRKHQKENLH
jgi:hypothetical protein